MWASGSGHPPAFGTQSSLVRLQPPAPVQSPTRREVIYRSYKPADAGQYRGRVPFTGH